MLVHDSWIVQKLDSNMKIKFGKFFQNPQEKDKEIKIVTEMTSDIEGEWKKKSNQHISRILERGKTRETEGEKNDLRKKIIFLSLRKT